jgi:hypothetical protein
MDFVQIPEFRLRLLDICTVEDKSWKKLMKLVVRAAKLRPTSIQANLPWMDRRLRTASTVIQVEPARYRIMLRYMIYRHPFISNKYPVTAFLCKSFASERKSRTQQPIHDL